MTLSAENRIRRVYEPDYGLPLSWREVHVGWLKDAVLRYADRLTLSDLHVARLVDYADYFIDAPAWTRADAYELHRFTAPALRRSIKHIETVDDFDIWRMGASAVGLDPFHGAIAYWRERSETREAA